MKTLYKSLSILLVIIFATSCNDEDFLEEKSPDKLTSESYWRDVNDAESGLVAAYSELESRSEFWDGWQEGRPVVEYFRSDYALPGPDASNYAHWMSMFNFTYDNAHTFINILWSTNYKGLNYANQVLTKIEEIAPDKISDADKKRIIGEATFLRGYYHFKLLTLYKQIVLREEMITYETLDRPLAERPEVWESILTDFQHAAEALPAEISPENYGRATRGAALAYLGKAYLHKAGDPTSASGNEFENAAAAFKQIVDAGTYTLEPDYQSLFNGHNENSSESVFELQFKAGDANSWNATILHAFIADWSFGGWGGIEATMGLVEEMKKEGPVANDGRYDNRLYNTLYFRDPFYNDPNTSEMRGSTWDTLMLTQYKDLHENHAYFRKWLPDYDEDNGYIGLNVVLMRYADVLLMYAETLNETGNTAEAVNLINQVRDIHGNMPPVTASSKEEVKEHIIHERTMEFTLESTRFFDLRRWGMLDSAMSKAGRTNFRSEQHAYLPVPQTEIQANPEID
ncbi:RagB/SusD family nutrient uptake outer membrane protein [Sinomicrobium weinanense]|uniref:RagB/SusD family nutrient uptake outer membrane protein n=1 Tax=Sinomicrobium weinanense TaxID=2842200 RepID=A0A926JRX0_9FLAO|nr:RagB/SusD family nutrient uptake outer membrane protein [Sinomicrobium weinanense]MBC9796261.1 RagB/SusD family nutrient uptake outer membrane protein [Sinomicrobium weinanense]MBU3122284.1 RagB/SusD family nutrient uptake outer membrane protein [Sinomicrobium weinanense]